MIIRMWLARLMFIVQWTKVVKEVKAVNKVLKGPLATGAYQLK